MLPHARPGGIAGLLELLNDRGGKEDLYRVADDLRMEVDDLLPIVEAATLLSFAKSDKGDVEITPAGKAFAEADIATRKTCSARRCSPTSRCCSRCTAPCTSKSDHTMPLEFFRDILDEHFASDEAQRQIETALNWGRYADIFTYDSDSDRLSLARSPRCPPDRRVARLRRARSHSCEAGDPVARTGPCPEHSGCPLERAPDTRRRCCETRRSSSRAWRSSMACSRWLITGPAR